MKFLRYLVPCLGFLALLALFLKMPEASSLAGITCKNCTVNSPYLPLLGSAYFAFLIAAALLFPTFPSRQVALGGWVWAVLLAATLTYLDLPHLCYLCLFSHLCHIMMWTIWLLIPSSKNEAATSPLNQRILLLFISPLVVVALFSSLNLHFMAYNFKFQNPLEMGLKVGEEVPIFNAITVSGKSISGRQPQEVLFNFISPNCPYCKEQMAVLNEIAPELLKKSVRIINISQINSPEFNTSHMEFVEDSQGEFRKLFKVTGYPTLFIVKEGKISEIILGAPEELKGKLMGRFKT